jgi:hypothetical protein
MGEIMKNNRIRLFQVLSLSLLLGLLVACKAKVIEETYITEEISPLTTLFGEDLVPFREGYRETGKWGYINIDGEIVIEPTYLYASKFESNDRAIVVTNVIEGRDSLTMKNGVINKLGEYVIEPAYDLINVYNNGFYVAMNFNSDQITSTKILDKNGFIVFDSIQYDEKYLSFSVDEYIDNNELYIFSVEETKYHKTCGYMKVDGEIVIEPIFSDCGPFSVDGFAYASPGYENSGMDLGGSNSNYGYINLKGEFVIKPNENWSEAVFILGDEDRTFNEGYALVYDLALEKVYFIDKTGKNVFGSVFDDADNFIDGVARVWLENGKSGYQMTYKIASIDVNGNLLSDYVVYNYDVDFGNWVGDEVNGMIIFAKNSKIGYMDSNMSVVIEAKYDYIDFGYTSGNFSSDGYAIVCLDNKSFIINKNGERIFDESFDIIKDQ